ncbi:MAG: S8 family serine peptidase [Bacteroidota bacterium]
MENLQVLVYLRDQADLDAVESALRLAIPPGGRIPPDVRYRAVAEALQRVASETQPRLLDRLAQMEAEGAVQVLHRFWIRNILVLRAPAPTVEEISSWPEVGTVYPDGLLERDLPLNGASAGPSPESAEAGLRAINAHRLWERGYTGAGRLVMNIDTGVNGNNSSFNTRWRGTLPGVNPYWAWFDPSGFTSFPSDGDASDNHGTHTMGIMCGLYAATSETLGVAPGARWIASNTLIGGSPHTSRSIAAFQWAANPDSNLSTMDDVPDAISNSWYDPDVSSTQCNPDAGGYAPVIQAVEALGTAVVFSAGNNGPGASSLTPPKNRLATAVDIFAVGAVDGNNPSFPIASFSSRGPSTCAGPDSLVIKPEVSAPGVSVRSANGSGGYRTLSGTSMASPHVAGGIALLREAAPYLTGTEIKRILLATARDLGDPGEDNTYGRGIIDLWAAFLGLADPGDPNPPVNASAYSDYSTPTSIQLRWTNPTTLAGGDPIGPFVIRILRDSVLVGEIPGPDSSVVNTGLTDGTLYRYVLRTRLIANDSLSPEARTEWIAGGSPVPAGPVGLSVSGTSAAGYTLRWTNPSRQADGTPLDDLAGVRLYRDGVPLTTIGRTAADTARADSAADSPPPGLHAYAVSVVDNELPPHESPPSNAACTPLELPFFDDFPSAGAPNTAVWRTLNASVDAQGVNPPSPPYALNLDGTPSANGDSVETLPLDLSGLQGAGVALSFFRQPRGAGENPELADSLIVEMRNSLGSWVQVRRWPGLNTADPVPPFAFDAVGLDGVDPRGGTFFYNGFRFRFRSRSTAGAYDDWYVDDVFFGVPSGPANVALAAVASPAGQVSANIPLTPVAEVRNVSAPPAGAFTVTMDIRGPGTPAVLSGTDSNLAAGSSRAVSFAPFTPDAVGLWDITCWVTLPGDPVGANDTLRSSFYAVNPLTLPLTEPFPGPGIPDPLTWTNVNAEVTPDAANEPSPPYALNLAGNPAGVGLDTVSSLTINLAGLQGSGVTLAFFQQPQGTGDAPETADSLIVEALDDLGLWRTVRKYPGAANRPFAFEKFILDSVDAGTGSFFHGGFKFRFRSRAQTGTTTPDDWFVDDVYFGIPAGNPVMVVSPSEIADTVLTGLVDTLSYFFTVWNNNPFASPLTVSVQESPEVPWLAAAPAVASIPGFTSIPVRVGVDFTGAATGTYLTQLVMTGNDPANPADTVAVAFRVNAAPSVTVSPDSFLLAFPLPGARTDSFLVSNTGVGPLAYDITVDPDIAGAARTEMTSPGGSSFTGSPRVRGNGVQVSLDATLIRIEFGLNITQDNTALDFFVYESPTPTGLFTRVFSSQKTLNATGGFQLVSSDPIRVGLTAGRWYYIGAAWQGGASTEYRYSTVTLPPAWGTVLGRYIGPNTAFPAPATLSIGSFTAGPYFSALETGTPFDLTLLSPSSGTVPPGGGARVAFRASTAGIPSGLYHNRILVASNDPVTPLVAVRVEVDNVTGVETPGGIPASYALFQNYPNPFNPSTTVRFAVPRESSVRLAVYNLLGQELALLADGPYQAGVHQMEWRGVNGAGVPLATGVYFYRLEARAADGSGSFVSLKKLLLLR